MNCEPWQNNAVIMPRQNICRKGAIHWNQLYIFSSNKGHKMQIDKQLDQIEKMLDNEFKDLGEFPELETDTLDGFNFSIDEDY